MAAGIQRRISQKHLGIRGYHNGVAEDSSLHGRSALSISE